MKAELVVPMFEGPGAEVELQALWSEDPDVAQIAERNWLYVSGIGFAGSDEASLRAEMQAMGPLVPGVRKQYSDLGLDPSVHDSRVLGDYIWGQAWHLNFLADPRSQAFLRRMSGSNLGEDDWDSGPLADIVSMTTRVHVPSRPSFSEIMEFRRSDAHRRFRRWVRGELERLDFRNSSLTLPQMSNEIGERMSYEIARAFPRSKPYLNFALTLASILPSPLALPATLVKAGATQVYRLYGSKNWALFLKDWGV